MPNRLPGWCAAACALAFLSLATRDAYGDSGGDFSLQTFRPAQDSKGMVTVNRSQVLGHLEPSMGLVTGWAAGLLSLERGDQGYDVEHVLSPTLLGAIGLHLWGQELQLGIALPFVVVSGDRSPNAGGHTPSDPNDDQNFSFQGQGLGSIALHAKWRLRGTSDWPLGVAIATGIDLPTTTQERQWLGSRRATPYAEVITDGRVGRLGFAANAGIRLPFGTQEFVDDSAELRGGMAVPITGERVARGPSLPLRAGISYMLVPERFEIVSELFGELVPNGENFQPVEALAGIKLYLATNSFLSLGGGSGLRRNVGGNPDLRAYAGIVFEPNVGDRDFDGRKDDVDRCPDEPEDFDDFEDGDGCPELDNDSDGILDVDDACPNTPEDRDGDEDDDGCPEETELDRDGDGIVDHDDQCPDDPEDEDGFEDAEGCPDADNDGDGILDIDDLCPDDAEDDDEFEDTDGCPDPDNDGDRIRDEDDECPGTDATAPDETREVYNTVDDDDGCPDRGPVTRTSGGIVLLEKIHFRYNSAELLEQSHGILRAVAMTLETNPDIAHIEVQGHTDERGTRAFNLDLSQRRAETVVTFLMAEGIASKRLTPKGYGEDKPKKRGHNERAWAANRRVEFIIREP